MTRPQRPPLRRRPLGHSPAEWRFENQVIAAWAEAIPSRDPAAAVGDWNGDHTIRRRLAVGDLADRMDARPPTHRRRHRLCPHPRLRR